MSVGTVSPGLHYPRCMRKPLYFFNLSLAWCESLRKKIVFYMMSVSGFRILPPSEATRLALACRLPDAESHVCQ